MTEQPCSIRVGTCVRSSTDHTLNLHPYHSQDLPWPDRPAKSYPWSYHRTVALHQQRSTTTTCGGCCGGRVAA